MKFNASALQFDVLEGKFDRNYNLFLTLLNLVPKGSLVVAPEVFPTGFFYRDMNGSATFSEKVVDDLIEFSRGLDLTVIFSVIEKVNGKFYNSVKVIDCGELLLSRPKVKLFPLTGETEHFSPGSFEDLKVVETSKGVIAPVVCFELRYPEIFENLKSKGAEIFVVTAQWGKARKEHWKVLTRARAIETQRFLVASNASGDMAGSSSIFDPWGRQLAAAEDGIALIFGTVNLSVIKQVEKKLPLI